jgi:hypothetical protein
MTSVYLPSPQLSIGGFRCTNSFFKDRIICFSLLILLFAANSCANPNFNTRTRLITAEEWKPGGSTENKIHSACANDFLYKLSQLPTHSTSRQLRFDQPSKRFTLRRHAQGIARLPAEPARFAITRHSAANEEEAGVLLIEFPAPGDVRYNRDRGAVTQFFSTADNKHPGGCQLIDNTLAVAHYGANTAMPGKGWISFYDIGANSIKEVNRFYLNGIDDRGGVYPIGKTFGPTSVAITQLANGWYLMFAFEARHKIKYNAGWFFVSKNKGLADAQWEFMQYWHETDLHATEAMPIYENVNLLSDCTTGTLYLLGFKGKRHQNLIDVYELTSDGEGRMSLIKKMQKRVTTSKRGASFRAGGSIFISSHGDIIIYAVEKNSNNESLVIEEFSESSHQP